MARRSHQPFWTAGRIRQLSRTFQCWDSLNQKASDCTDGGSWRNTTIIVGMCVVTEFKRRSFKDEDIDDFIERNQQHQHQYTVGGEQQTNATSDLSLATALRSMSRVAYIKNNREVFSTTVGATHRNPRQSERRRTQA